MNEHQEPLSWDSEREHAPERPSYVVSVTQAEVIDRPKRVSVAYTLVILAVVGTLTVNVLAAFGFEALRESLLTAMPDDLTETYEQDELDRAVNLLLISVAGLVAVLSVLQLVSMHSCHRHGRASGRAWLMILTVISLPVVFLGMLIRSVDALDVAASASIAVCYIVAVALLATPLTSQWLRQDERPRSTPLTELQHTKPAN